MRILTIVAAIFWLASANALAAPTIEHQEGRVLYSSGCVSGYAFSYFDGQHLQRPCIADSENVTLDDFRFTSRHTDCRGRVLVLSGTAHDGVLSADGIEEVWGCAIR